LEKQSKQLKKIYHKIQGKLKHREGKRGTVASKAKVAVAAVFTWTV